MRAELYSLLKQMYGENAKFREGQLEAIEEVVLGNRVLVVQKTGWGKSTVYFIATKYLRKNDKGPTILISPLLSLMRNQIESANKLGLNAYTIHSGNSEEWEIAKIALLNNRCDILLVSPERLGNDEFINEILPLFRGGIGMFVVDEAHCISDWGHDFRPDYKRIVNIIKTLPPSVPLLATTATANDRVVEDVKRQLGNSICVQRGPLGRDSLKLNVIHLKSQTERLSWLIRALTNIDGSGIIYCLTVSDCERVSKWLRLNGIYAVSYHSQLKAEGFSSNEIREQREQMLLKNEVKALVATIALGMGFDKPDLSFVIHYQRPGSLVAYYQQIGRAGRSLDSAEVILLCGEEDDEIQEYFIKSAFPTIEMVLIVLSMIEESANGITKDELLMSINCTVGTVDKCLNFLTIEQVIQKNGPKYYRSPIQWLPSTELSQKVTEMRYQELRDIKEFTYTKQCYMKFIADKLDDPYAQNCGKCAICTGFNKYRYDLFPSEVSKAESYLKHDSLKFSKRKQWPAGIISIGRKNIQANELVDDGIILSIYGDAGWGSKVKQGKYVDQYFSEELVDASVELITKWEQYGQYDSITYVPSLKHPTLVSNFAKRLSLKLGLPCIDAIIKELDNKPQKCCENSYQQCQNAYGSFSVTENVIGKRVLLVDDMIDSGWTVTVCGSLLKRAGATGVFVFALASSSKTGD